MSRHLSGRLLSSPMGFRYTKGKNMCGPLPLASAYLGHPFQALGELHLRVDGLAARGV